MKSNKLFYEMGIGLILAVIYPSFYSLVIYVVPTELIALISFLGLSVLGVGILWAVATVGIWSYVRFTIENTWLAKVWEAVVSPMTLLLHGLFGLVIAIVLFGENLTLTGSNFGGSNFGASAILIVHAISLVFRSLARSSEEAEG